MINYRNYTTNDFEQVLDLLQASLRHDVMTKSLLEEKLYRDPGWNQAHTFIAAEGKELSGFLQSVIRNVYDEKICYIKLLAVNEEFRRQGIASHLFSMTKELALSEKCSKIRFLDSTLNYFVPGIDPQYTESVCFAEKLGFKRFGEAINMSVNLDHSDWEVKEQIMELRNQGIEVSRADQKDMPSLTLLLEEEWPLWINEVSVAMKANPPAVFIAKKEHRVLAFSAYDANNIGTAWFGPMGTHSELRGLGIGGVLLKLCLSEMKKQGHKFSTIPWVGPVKFYSDYTGARISRIFWRYEMEV